MRYFFPIFLVCAVSNSIFANDPTSLQSALDQTPARSLFVPPGDHYIDQPLLITQSGSGLYGPGRIVQRNPQAAILLIRGASDVTVSGLTFTRAEGTMDTTFPGIKAQDCANLTLENLDVLDNRSPAGSIRMERCEYTTIRECLLGQFVKKAPQKGRIIS